MNNKRQKTNYNIHRPITAEALDFELYKSYSP